MYTSLVHPNMNIHVYCDVLLIIVYLGDIGICMVMLVVLYKPNTIIHVYVCSCIQYVIMHILYDKLYKRFTNICVESTTT